MEEVKEVKDVEFEEYESVALDETVGVGVNISSELSIVLVIILSVINEIV